MTHNALFRVQIKVPAIQLCKLQHCSCMHVFLLLLHHASGRQPHVELLWLPHIIITLATTSASIIISNILLCGTSAAVYVGICTHRLASVHEHPFAYVWEAARQKQPIGDVHPDAAYNALAVLFQVILGNAQGMLWLCLSFSRQYL